MMKKMHTAIARGSYVLCLLAAGTMTPSLASAACVQWDVGGTWKAMQSNGAETTIVLQQSGSALRGKGRYMKKATSSRFGGIEEGALDGTIKGNAIRFSIYWGKSSVGSYVGTISATGRIEGTTFDKRNPSSRAAWYSSARMRCVRSR